VGDAKWVCLVLDRKVWKACLDIVMFVQTVQEAGKCVANGAIVTGTFGGDFMLESSSEVNL